MMVRPRCSLDRRSGGRNEQRVQSLYSVNFPWKHVLHESAKLIRDKMAYLDKFRRRQQHRETWHEDSQIWSGGRCRYLDQSFSTICSSCGDKFVRIVLSPPALVGTSLNDSCTSIVAIIPRYCPVYS